MLASSVFFETSIPNTPSITVLSFHFHLLSKSSASNNLVRRIYAHARPKIPSDLKSGAWKTGPNLWDRLTRQAPTQAHRLLAAGEICLFAKQSATYKSPRHH